MTKKSTSGGAGPKNGGADVQQLAAEYDTIEAAVLGGLEERFAAAQEARAEGDDAGAERSLRAILAVEPRLAEPRLELAHIAASRGDFDEAEGQAQEAVEILRAGGQWTLDIDPDVLLAFALNLWGELILIALEGIDSDDLDEAEVRRIKGRWMQARALFEEAHTLDPDNEDAAINYTGMSIEG
jgi:tetratricopeptide (TPR) repeat protein